MAPIFGYWKIRGLGQPIRYLLRYLEIECEERNYTSPEEWFEKDKPNLGLDFPNLPYFVDGDIKLTQSTAIMRYLADKHNIAGSTDQERARVLVAEYQLVDLRTPYGMTIFAPNPEFEMKKKAFAQALPEKLKPWSDFLSGNHFVAGKNVTYVDFLLYELLYHLSKFLPGCLDQFQSLADYVNRVENLPAMAKYRTSPNFIDKPFYSSRATWTGPD